MGNAGLHESQAGIKTSGRNISILRYADNTTLMAESEEELKSLLIRMKEESEKAGLKLNIQNTKTMASGTITSWQREEENVETVTDFIFLGSKITVDCDCSHDIKNTCSLESYEKPRQHIKKQKRRDITLPTNVHTVKLLFFPVILYGCESWSIKKTEC